MILNFVSNHLNAQVAIRGKGGAITYTDEGRDIAAVPQDDLLVLHLNIEGMSCSSCVNTIEQNISRKNGVVGVKVFLDDKKGVITFSPTKTSVKVLSNAISELGFEPTLKMTVEKVEDEAKKKGEEKEIHIRVLGMTCQSCVKTINYALSRVNGIKNVQVSVENKEAIIKYDPLLTSSSELRDIINDAGFEASLVGSKVLQENVSVSIVGMTCQSCVRTIEQNIGQLDGVNLITVSLENKNAAISFNPSKTGPEQLRLAIEEMGFEASLPNSGSDIKLDTNVKTAIINVEGMTCMSCVNTIKGGIAGVTGVKSIEVSLSDKEAVILYDPTLTKEESLAMQIEDMGFITSIPSKGRSLYARDVQ